MDTAHTSTDRPAAPVEHEGYAEALTRGLASETAAPAKSTVSAAPPPALKNIARLVREQIIANVSIGDIIAAKQIANYVGASKYPFDECERIISCVSSELSRLNLAGVLRVAETHSREGRGGKPWYGYELLHKSFDVRNGVFGLIAPKLEERRKARHEALMAAIPKRDPEAADIGSESAPSSSPPASKTMSLSDRVDGYLKIAALMERTAGEIVAELRAENAKPNLILATDEELLAELTFRAQARNPQPLA